MQCVIKPFLVSSVDYIQWPQKVFYGVKWIRESFGIMQKVTNRGKPSTSFWINSLNL